MGINGIENLIEEDRYDPQFYQNILDDSEDEDED